MIKDLVTRNRTFRKFNEEIIIKKSTLLDFIDTARVTASARNIQPLKYACTNDATLCEKIFSTLGWAGYLENGAPIKGERPTGYIIIFNDKNIAPASLWDQGIVSQTITLAACQQGLGCCIIASVNREKLAEIIEIPSQWETALVIAIGHPTETVKLIDMTDNQFKYFRDKDSVHYVPKRVMNEIYLEIEK